ncbi:Ig-like domain-containing protein [Robertkochia solimangrovi]|uniref:Ig-like domain-containing protein n=1 Tax=Robertkochia solimangrovi TaxID=2213046 RepID=UPI00117DB1AE|nr:Ig-like domain-containing protein [Robertkochia solimangrovi]TRZ41376.1 hypothetical protein DMZ48_16965 [Robertkochia solimangrovi]
MPKNYLKVVILSCLLIACSKDTAEAPDVTPPEISFTIDGISEEPDEIAIVSSKIDISIDAKDEKGISKIEAFINGDLVGEDNTAPYSISVDLSSYAYKTAKKVERKTLYTLTVTATDNSGNTSSQETQIIVDNELPVISEVSITNDTIIAGNGNLLSFKATDNDGISILELTINDILAETTLIDGVYTYNLNTLELQDGQNSFMIKAFDGAGNSTEYKANFIVDNTAPKITLNGISNGELLDGLRNLTPTMEDTYSSLDSITLMINDSILIKSKYTSGIEIEIDPEDFKTGETIVTVIGSDNLGNKDTLTVSTEIKRLLFTMNIPEGFLRSSWTSFWVILSEMDGSSIMNRTLELGDKTVKIHAPDEFEKDHKYMVTFLSESNNGYTMASNIQYLDRNNFSEMNFRLAPNVTINKSTTFGVEGFSTTAPDIEYFSGNGNGYYLYHDSNSNPPYGLIHESTLSPGYEEYYAYSTNLDIAPYAYKILPSTVDQNYTINKSEFITDGVETKDFTISNDPLLNNRILEIHGYTSAANYEDGRYHQIYFSGLERVFGEKYQYQLNTNFEQYNHFILLGDYYTQREGPPLSNYTMKDWTVSYSENGTDISLNLTGTEHHTGRALIRRFNSGDYDMTIIFPTQELSELHFPNLPEELSHLPLYQDYIAGATDVEVMTVSSYEILPTYNDYIEQVVSNQKEDKEISGTLEAKLSTPDNYYNFYNFFNF